MARLSQSSKLRTSVNRLVSTSALVSNFAKLKTKVETFEEKSREFVVWKESAIYCLTLELQ